MLDIPTSLIATYAGFQVFLYWIRKHREVFMAERFAGSELTVGIRGVGPRMRGFEKVMFGWILLMVLFQAGFLIYYATRSGIVSAILLFVVAFVFSLLIQMLSQLVFKRATPMAMTLLSFVGVPILAIIMIALVP